MSYGQAPFNTNYSANTARLINVSGEVFDEDEPITFVRAVGNGQTLYASALSTFTFNPFSDLMKVENILSETIELTDLNVFPTNMRMSCANGQVFFQAQPTLLPYDSGLVTIGGLGTIAISGGSSFIYIGDRSTGDIFQLFSSGGVFTLKSNFTQNVFQVTTSGLASLIGTSAGVRFYERLASPTNYYDLFTSASGSVFTLAYNGSSIATIGSTGITTLVPQKIQNTLSSSASAHFLTFVPLSATTTAGQVISTNASLNYVPSTGTLSATVFSGSLTGSATLIDTTLQTTGTQFLTMVPLSATTSSGQVAGTHASLTYDVSSSTLSCTNMNATTFTGSLTGSATLIDTTLQTTGTQFLAMVPLSATTSAGQVAGTHATLTYNVATATLATTNMTATTFTGSLTGSATLMDNTLQTTGTQFLTMMPLSATTSTGQVVGTHASLTYDVSSSTLACTNMNATTFTGSLTGSATLIDTTLQTTGTQFLTMVPLSATTSGGQVAGTHATLTYNVANGTLSATTFSGSLTGSATLIDTTAITTGTRYLTFVPLATTQTAGQVLGTQSQIFYVVNENQLNLGTTAGYTGADSVPLSMLNNTLAVGEYNIIQIGYQNAVYDSWFFGPRYDAGSSTTIFAFAPYGVALTDNFYITGYGTASSLVLEARNNLSLYDSVTTQYAQIYASTGGLVSAYNNVILNTAYSGGPLSSGRTLQIGDSVGPAELILADIATAKWGIGTTGYRFSISSDYFSSAGNVYDSLYGISHFGINDWYTNESQAILLDVPIMNLDDDPIFYSSGLPQTLNDFVAVDLQAGGNNIYTLTVKVNGNNPFGRTITISNQVALNFTLTAVTGATFPTTFTITPSVGSQSATINGSPFTGYTYSTTGFATYNYFQSAISVWTIFQPVGQSTWVITPNNTGNEIDTYVFTIDYNRASPTLTGVSVLNRSANLDGSFITLKGTTTTLSSSRFSGTGTLTTSSTPVTTTLSTVRSGASLLQLDNAVQVSATTSKTTLQTTGTQFIPLVAGSATNSTTGQALGTHAGLNYDVATGTLSSTIFSGSLTGGATLIDTTLQTTGTQFPLMAPLSATTPAGQVAGTHASLTYNVATATLATTNMTATTFTGSLTGSASLVDNTLQTTGTQFLTMMPLSATTSAGQVVGTHGTLSYNVATATLATTNMTATTFTGSLTGSATLIDTTLQTTGTQFLTMVPLSATTSSGQVAGTHASLSYNVASSILISPNYNLIYNATVTASSGTAYVPNIFTSAYTDYEITVSISSPVTTGATLSFDLITGTNTRLALGWDTLTSYVNGTAMVSLTPPTSLCYFTSLPAIANTMKHKAVVTNPTSVLLDKQFIAGPNIGYLTGGGSPTQTTYTSTGINTGGTAQTGFALIITGGGSWTATVKVRGFNF